MVYRDFKYIETSALKYSRNNLLPSILYAVSADGKSISKLPLSNKFKTRMNIARPATQIEFDRANQERIAPYFNLFHSAYMEFSGVHVAHGPFVSSFRLNTNEWI